MQTENSKNAGRLAGAALAGASVLSIAVMAHHPTGFDHPVLTQIVHGAMIALVLVMLAGYVRLTSALGLDRFANSLAIIIYGAGAGANVLAGTINGFVTGRIAAPGGGQDVLRLCWELNQALAYGAVYAASIAFLIWGTQLMERRGMSRIVGFIGVAAAIAPAVMLATNTLAMNVAGAFMVYALQAAFGVAAGADLVRHALRSEQAHV